MGTTAGSNRTVHLVGLAVALAASLFAADTRADDPAERLSVRLSVASVLMPLPSERLPEPIALDCPGMKVVEWRPDHQVGAITGPTPAGIDVLNRFCKLARDRYPEFLRSKRLRYEIHEIEVAVSLMPGNILLEGREARNLNGTRFASARPGKDDIWGVFYRREHALFLRNDPVTIVRGVAVSHAPFARTFLHEQAHVLNHAWNVPSLNELSTVDDESLAEEWVHWLGGYTARCESSETDREAKKAGGMLAPTKNTGEVAGIGSAIN